jgi:hypothetical protein
MKSDNKNSLILYIAFLSGMHACSAFAKATVSPGRLQPVTQDGNPPYNR